jgi:hypothetical protein
LLLLVSLELDVLPAGVVALVDEVLEEESVVDVDTEDDEDKVRVEDEALLLL